MSNDCLFCKIISGDIPSNKVYSDDHVYAFHDINPAAPTHVLVIPRKHLSAVNDRSEEHEPLLGALMAAANRIVAQLEPGRIRLPLCHQHRKPWWPNRFSPSSSHSWRPSLDLASGLNQRSAKPCKAEIASVSASTAPCSVISAVTRRAGVTSKPGLLVLTPGGAVRTRPVARQA